MPLIISLAIIILTSFIFGQIAHKFHFSKVIGLIFAGLFFSLPPLKEAVISPSQTEIYLLSKAGLFALMFLAGFEISWHMLVKERGEAVVVTIFTILSSLALGFIVFMILGFTVQASLIMGVCFGITAEATKARVLVQLKKLKTRIGALFMGAGIINDIFGIFALGVISYIFTSHFSWSEFNNLALAIIAFACGILVHYYFNRYSRAVKLIEKLLLIFLTPFLFVSIGLKFNINSIFLDPKIFFITLITATSGQMLGSFLIKPISRFNFKQLYLIGWGMNSKGAVELAIALIALEAGILPVNLYSSLVVTALVSTIIFQIVIFRMVLNDPKIMD